MTVHGCVCAAWEMLKHFPSINGYSLVCHRGFWLVPWRSEWRMVGHLLIFQIKGSVHSRFGRGKPLCINFYLSGIPRSLCLQACYAHYKVLPPSLLDFLLLIYYEECWNIQRLGRNTQNSQLDRNRDRNYGREISLLEHPRRVRSQGPTHLHLTRFHLILQCLIWLGWPFKYTYMLKWRTNDHIPKRTSDVGLKHRSIDINVEIHGVLENIHHSLEFWDIADNLPIPK